MIFRKSLYTVVFCAVAFTAAAQAQYLVTFQGPQTVSQDPTVTFYDPATLQPGSTFFVNGAFQFLSLSDGSEIYFIMNTGGVPGPAITVVHPKSKSTVGSMHQIGNFANTLNCAALSPDDSTLVVGENSVHLFDTGTNVDLTPNGIALGGGATVLGVAVSYDSQTVYALATYNGSSYLAAISIPQLSITNTLNVSGTASALALGPNGLLYVGINNQILEVNPATLTTTPNGVASVNITAGPFAFTPDGNYLLAANQTYSDQPALVLLNLNDHLVEGLVPFTGLSALASSLLTGFPAVFDSLYLASSNVIYPFSSGGQQLFDVLLGTNGGLILTEPVIPPLDTAAQAAMTLSNDLGLPGRNFPQFMFTVSNGSVDGTGVDNLFQIDPASSSLSAQTPLLSAPGAVAYYTPTFTVNTPTTILQYGNNQNLLPGGVSLPMVIRVLDQNGLPIARTGVSFGIPFGTTGLISPVNTVTGADGYAEAIFTAGSTTADLGQQNISVTVGEAATGFNVTVGTGQTAVPGGMSIVSGQGQLIMEDPQLDTSPVDNVPMVVLVTDTNGNPLPSTLVTFAITSGNGALQATTGGPSQSQIVTPTNTQGQASITFVPPLVGSQGSFYSTTVTASIANGTGTGATTYSQNFYATSMLFNDTYCGLPPCYPYINPLLAQVLQPTPNTVFEGAADSTLPNPVVVSVYTPNFMPVPNVAVKVSTTATSSEQPNATCAGANTGGLAITNANGVATCNLVLNGSPGTLPLTISVPEIGSVYNEGMIFSGYKLTILPGSPANIKIIGSGNNQTALTGMTLPVPFIVQVTDASGNPIPGQTVNWQVVSGQMTLSSVTTVTNLNGEVTATGTVLSPGGTVITLNVTAGSVTFPITVYVTVPVATVKIVSGNNQSATVNTAIANPLVVQLLDKSNNPAPYAPVFFAAGGTAKLSATSTASDTNGMASTTVTTVGYAAGPFTVTASLVVNGKIVKATFNLTALSPGPTGSITVVNSASLTANIAPGGLVTFFGQGLAPTIQGVVTDPSQLQGYSVSFDGINAPILAVANNNGMGQINAQVPFEEAVGPSDSVIISTPNGSIGINPISVSDLAPAIFTYGSLAPEEPLAMVLRSDGSYAGASNPVQPGEMITFFATGLGQTAPLASTGVLGVPDQVVASTLYAGLNNQGDPVLSAIYEPGAQGLYAVTLQIPSTTASNPAAPLGLVMVDSQGNSYSAPPVYVPVQ